MVPWLLVSSCGCGVKAVGFSEGTTEVAGAPEALHPEGTERYRMTVVDDSDAFVSLVAEVIADRFVVTGIKPNSLDDVTQSEPDVLMVDLNPRGVGLRDGWRLIEAARAHQRLRDVPIILCTGMAEADGEVERALRYPAVQLLTKPFALDALDDALARAVSRKTALNGDGTAPG
jgi:CheY-like chemotaxis protein